MVSLAVPVVLSELGWMAMGVVDTIMVGALGPAAIGAVALGNAVCYTPSIFGMGLVLGLDTLVAQAYGREDHDECHRWLAQGVYLACIAAVPIMVGIALACLGFTHLGIAAEVAGPASGYLRLLNWGTLPLLLYGATRRYLQGVGQVRVITVTYVLANLVNWFLNWVLIYGKLGMPAMGVNGSAISTVFARVTMAAGADRVCVEVRTQTRASAVPALGGTAGGAAEAPAEVGRSGGGTDSAGGGRVESGDVFRGVSDAGGAGHAPDCAELRERDVHGAAGDFGSGGGERGPRGGRGRSRRGRGGPGWLALGLGTSFMLLAAVALLVWPRPLIELYTRDARVLAVGPGLLAIVAAFEVFDGIQTVSTGALRGLGETRAPMMGEPGGVLGAGIAAGVLSLFWIKVGDLRIVDWADAGAGGDCAGADCEVEEGRGKAASSC